MEEREAEIWSYAMDHVHRLGRQQAALVAGGRHQAAAKVYEAATQFIDLFGYGEEGRRSLTAVYRMAKMEDTKRSLWMGAWKW